MVFSSLYLAFRALLGIREVELGLFARQIATVRDHANVSRSQEHVV